jgi:hypothetical protein
MYVGQEGFVIGIIASGEAVERFTADGNQRGESFVTIKGLGTRVTDRRTLNFSKDSTIVTLFHPRPPPSFPYYTETLSEDMATVAYMQSQPVGHFLSMPLRITSVQVKESWATYSHLHRPTPGGRRPAGARSQEA